MLPASAPVSVLPSCAFTDMGRGWLHQMPSGGSNAKHAFWNTRFGGVGMLDVRFLVLNCYQSKCLSPIQSANFYLSKAPKIISGSFNLRPSDLASWIILRCFWLYTNKKFVESCQNQSIINLYGLNMYEYPYRCIYLHLLEMVGQNLHKIPQGVIY